MLLMSHLNAGKSKNILTSTVSSKILIFPSETTDGDTSNFKADVRDCNQIPDYPVGESKSDSEKLLILCSTYHEPGSLLAFCDSRKNLVLYDVAQNVLQGSIKLVRKCFKVVISNDCHYVLAADKSGDVYLYDIDRKQLDGNPILGHVSMLLDMVLTPCSKYVITCDRDEKIRVSHFPRAYQIQSYCLGHKEFVSTLKLLPVSSDVLLSAAGDGTVKLWKYLEGRSIFTLQFPTSQCEVDKAEVPPVIFCDITLTDNESYILSSAIKGLEKWIIMVHRMTIAKENVVASFLWKLDFTVEIGFLFFKKTSLWLMCHDEKNIRILDAMSPTSNCTPNSLKTYLESANKAITDSKILEDLPSLDIKTYYKTWFDNIDLYYENKNRRIAEKEMKNSAKRIKSKHCS